MMEVFRNDAEIDANTPLVVGLVLLLFVAVVDAVLFVLSTTCLVERLVIVLRVKRALAADVPTKRVALVSLIATTIAVVGRFDAGRPKCSVSAPSGASIQASAYRRIRSLDQYQRTERLGLFRCFNGRSKAFAFQGRMERFEVPRLWGGAAATITAKLMQLTAAAIDKPRNT